MCVKNTKKVGFDFRCVRWATYNCVAQVFIIVFGGLCSIAALFESVRDYQREYVMIRHNMFPMCLSAAKEKRELCKLSSPCDGYKPFNYSQNPAAKDDAELGLVEQTHTMKLDDIPLGQRDVACILL